MEAELGRILQNERLIRVIGRCDVFYARMPSNNKTSCSESGNDRTIGEHIAKPSERMEALDDLSFKKLIAARCGTPSLAIAGTHAPAFVVKDTIRIRSVLGTRASL